MQELFEQILDYLKGIWLKRRYIMISTWLICPIAWIYIAQMDNIYESKARVYVDTQSLLRPLLRGLTVETNPDVQINLMVKTLLSRPNLERITRMTDLDIQANTPEAFEKLIADLKNNIHMSKPGRGSENIYNISYEHNDPEVAKKVVESALTVFIENTLGENRNDSDSATKFLDSQIKEYEERLLEAETKLTAFKQKYSDILPESNGGFYNQLKQAKASLEEALLRLNEVNSKIDAAKKLIPKASDINATSDKIKDGTGVTTDYDSRINQAESQLDALLLKYTEKHPDVVETKRLLESLTNARQKELDEYYAALTKENENSNGINSLNTNPIYQDVQIQINQLTNEAASLRVRVKNYENKVKEYENKMHLVPEIEAESTALNRGYSITKQKYEQLLNRKETAKLAKQADETTSKINFRIIDPPRVPTEPTGPKRILFLVFSTIFAIGVGVGLSLLFSQLNPVVTSRNQVTKETGIPVFGVVSATENIGLQAWHKKKTVLFIISNTLLVGLLLCFIIYSLYPEQVLAPFKGVL